MTAIVGVRYNGGAAIGLDSWTEWGDGQGCRISSKYIHRWPCIGKHTDLLVASAGNHAFNTVLDEWDPKYYAKADPMLITAGLRTFMMEHPLWDFLLEEKDGRKELDGELLMAFGDLVWGVGGAFSIHEPLDHNYLAMGAADQIIMGAMSATQGLFLDQEDGWLSRLTLALKAAEDHHSTVRSPFHIVTTTGESYG